jgi:hypothetical protein
LKRYWQLKEITVKHSRQDQFDKLLTQESYQVVNDVNDRGILERLAGLKVHLKVGTHGQNNGWSLIRMGTYLL